MRGSGVLPAAAAFVVLSLLSVGCVPAPPAPSATNAAAPAQSTTAATAAGAAQRGGTLVVAFNADPETLDQIGRAHV